MFERTADEVKEALEKGLARKGASSVVISGQRSADTLVPRRDQMATGDKIVTGGSPLSENHHVSGRKRAR